jgi:PTH1 family peptidyl-tRNA hydrolase
MPSARLRLVAGLGNPGKSYVQTRHNAGFIVADKIAETFGISFGKKKFDTLYGRGSIEGSEIILAKPMAFMNRSGPPLKKLADFFKIPGEDMLVIHDDIDLAFGRLKIKEKGGHGGHNGLRSLIDAFGNGDFVRLRIGVGRSKGGSSVTGHVLGSFSVEENESLNRILIAGRDAVVTILWRGTKVGMNFFNNKNFLITC